MKMFESFITESRDERMKFMQDVTDFVYNGDSDQSKSLINRIHDCISW